MKGLHTCIEGKEGKEGGENEKERGQGIDRGREDTKKHGRERKGSRGRGNIEGETQ